MTNNVTYKANKGTRLFIRFLRENHISYAFIYEHDKLEQGFRMYYKEIVTEQQQDEWTNEKYTTRFHD